MLDDEGGRLVEKPVKNVKMTVSLEFVVAILKSLVGLG